MTSEMGTEKTARIQGKTPTEIKRIVRNFMLAHGYTLKYSRKVANGLVEILSAPPVAERKP